MPTLQHAKPTTVLAWTRLRTGEKKTLAALSRTRGVPQALLLGFAVRQWVEQRKQLGTWPPMRSTRGATTMERRGTVTPARVRAADSRALASIQRETGQSICLLVRRAFLWWWQHGAPE